MYCIDRLAYKGALCKRSRMDGLADKIGMQL
jgi:hypothetical protein